MHILIAHPSPINVSRLRNAFTKLSEVTEVACVSNLTECYNYAEHRCPDAVIIDAEMASCAEFELLSSLLRILQVGCVLLHPERRQGPIYPGHDGPHVSHYEGAPDATAILLNVRALRLYPTARRAQATPTDHVQEFAQGKIILIGASTGGIDALIKVVGNFDQTCPPTLIVQHTGGAFAQSLIRLLDGATKATVVSAADRAQLAPGHIYLAPGDAHHLCLGGRPKPYLVLRDDPPVSGHRPSVDALFKSAVPFAHDVAAALLTGMGRDGADGLLALRQNGAHTLCQDEASSVVYGMPRVAKEMDAVVEELPITRIGPALLRASAAKVRA